MIGSFDLMALKKLREHSVCLYNNGRNPQAVLVSMQSLSLILQPVVEEFRFVDFQCLSISQQPVAKFTSCF
jgi:hypothetical protein